MKKDPEQIKEQIRKLDMSSKLCSTSSKVSHHILCGCTIERLNKPKTTYLQVEYAFDRFVVIFGLQVSRLSLNPNKYTQ